MKYELLYLTAAFSEVSWLTQSPLPSPPLLSPPTYTLHSSNNAAGVAHVTRSASAVRGLQRISVRIIATIPLKDPPTGLQCFMSKESPQHMM